MARYKTGGYKISDIYQGGYSSLNPSNNYAPKNYIAAGTLGMTTDPRTANILQEVSTKLSSGVKQIEVSAVSPEVFDSMPKQQLKEVNRLSKLTGVDISLHGPVINISGINQQGFSETEREAAERRVAETLLRAKELNPDGNIPVTFHSAEGIPGSQPLPPSSSQRKEEKGYQRLIIVNKDSGKMAPLEPEIRYSPGEKLEPEHLTPEKRLSKINRDEWINSLNQLFFNKERADRILEETKPFLDHLRDPKTGKMPEIKEFPSDVQADIKRRFEAVESYLGDVHSQVSLLFSKAYEFGNEHQREILKSYSEQFRKDIEGPYDPFAQARAMQDLLNNMKSQQIAPEMWVPVEKFAVEKSSQTFGNSAFNAYKKFKDKAPVLVIENPPAGFALSTGEDIKNIVKESRKQFVERAKKEGMPESQAKRQAEKLIGATWDVGHINMLRKYGYTEEDIVEETKKIAPYVKHIHLSDNFGFEHTELPMGMGNVPLKKMMEKLGKKGFESKKIIEAAQWWQHFRTPPFQEVLEAVGSPVYSMKMAPRWSQAVELQEGYFSGYGQMLPQINYETFGAGFSQLPQELGGQMPGARGNRMSGRPME